MQATNIAAATMKCVRVRDPIVAPSGALLSIPIVS
jgi:hypothetical protein